MESYEKYYRNFARPPMAPVYYPSAEEFTDPIAYVAKIRPEAEHYGVVKIVPPTVFKPPFAIDPEAFEFTPRVQRLNEIEAIVREKHMFNERLAHYWNLRGGQFKIPWVDGKYVDLFKLNKIVTAMGGPAAVTRKKQWTQLAKKVNVKSHQGSSKLKEHYNTLIVPFLKSLEEKWTEDTSESEDDMKDEKDEKGECEQTMQGRRRAARPSGRMMAGLAQPKNNGKMNHAKANKKSADPMENVFCIVCERGDDEDRLMLCEDCDKSMHTLCCDPPMKEVPKGEWRCPQCVAAEVAKVGANFGFYDATTKYNINSFAEYADDFKRKYFGVKQPREVPCEAVEREFWKLVISAEDPVAVKYGADLITSKVGSGFPRKGDDHRGVDARLKAHYASHAWNLNNLPVLKESVLSHIDTGISGMMVPWVYVGMCFSTFCWHTEDHWTYSINYNHWGERKIWYGVGGQDAEKFEDAVREVAPGLTTHQKDIFHHMTTAVNPALLSAKGVDVWTVHQNAGEFVITFPRAYHAGYNEGVNFAEAVNFAPIDWLKTGRLCVNEYANVRRFCVFSHDELVLKMVSACDKLGISMSLAALDELLMMSKRESTGRSLVQRSGVRRAQKENFEQMPDDARVCRHCNTTIFLSALKCAHNKTVCLEHIDHLCTKCPSSECVLKYRYKMEELEPMIKKLEDRTTLYFEWADQVDNVLNDPRQKPRLTAVENLMETARQKRFPHALPLQRLTAVAKACNAALERARTLLNGKVRTRKETRIQRADTRLDISGVKSLMDELNDLPCDVEEHMQKLENLLTSISAWQAEARLATAGDAVLATDAEKLRQLVQRGEDFDVRMEELQLLRKAVNTREWRLRADRLLAWESHPGMEEESDFESRRRWELDLVLRMIKDGSELMRDGEPMPAVERLHARYKTAVRIDNMADRLLSSGSTTVDELEQLWVEARESDWCTAKGIDWMRHEIVQSRHLGMDLKTSQITLKEISRLVDKCQKSAVLSSTPAHSEMVAVRDRLEKFTERMCSLFHKPHSYYDLVEIIRDRDDLAALIEGQTVVRHLHTPSTSVDEWEHLTEFKSIDAVVAHLEKLRDQQNNLMASLQLANSQRQPRDTCICALEKDADKHGGIVTCLLCRAKYHGVCCEWDSFLGRLPEGAFLCVRCLRGRRPCLEDVQAACNQAPANSLEVALVRQLLQRVRDSSGNAMEILADIAISPASWNEELIRRVESLVVSVLSCELLDLDVFSKVVAILPKVFGDIMAAQKEVCAVIRDRPVRAVPLELLFATPRRKTKRASAGKEVTSRRDRKRARAVAVYHEDDQACSADRCLKPYGEHVGWIQCEAGCARWYHYVCVGQTVEGAKSIQVYSCYRCSESPQSSPEC